MTQFGWNQRTAVTNGDSVTSEEKMRLNSHADISNI
jgi:hypothetical protein